MTREEKSLRRAARQERTLEQEADRILRLAGAEVYGTVQSPLTVGGLHELATLEAAGHVVR